ncbi:c-type cytochrome biogenesis protein CcmI [Thiohalorhabdus sp.]|uniref:c-type cytochrome biogenesis protein CcmI n=1 Tax=Thiohalorhabdus sp. TaxID=3094134 RepID=UPI002FC2BE49
MIVFWIVVAALIVAAVAAVVPALLGRVRMPGSNHMATNVAVFRDRLNELQADRDRGKLSPGQYEAAKEELEQEFAQEIPAERGRDEPVRHPGRGRWSLAMVGLGVPVITVVLYLSLGRPDLVAQPPATRMPEQQIQQFVQLPTAQRIPALKRYLDNNPRTGEAWFLLGQSLREQDQYGEAVEAYDRARDFMGDQAQLLAGYAEAVALSNDRQITDRARDLAEKALEQDPENQLALWLAGSGAMANDDRDQAVQYWRRLARQLPADSQSAQMIRGYIAQAEGISASEVTIDRPQQEPGAGPALTVAVSLSGNLKAQAEPDQTVFIFARSPQGPPMPVAAVRKKVADLPVTVTLSDAQAMTPQRTLSQQERIVVGARVSKSGRPMASSGDLQGLSDTVPVEDGRQIDITIDSQVP